jgi:hypothetical protein
MQLDAHGGARVPADRGVVGNDLLSEEVEDAFLLRLGIASGRERRDMSR